MAGGSASSITTDEGFTFDYGGHVLYPHEHYSNFTSLLEELVPEWHESVPIRGVWMDGRLIPYPLQRNVHRLSTRKLIEALTGLVAVRLRNHFRPKAAPASSDLQSYLEHTFGRGLTRVALGPLNRKMWAHEPKCLASDWTAQRSGSNTPNVTNARLRELLRSIVTRRDNPGWSAKTLVRYPARGGSGSIWSALARRFPEHALHSAEIVGVDDRTKIIRLADGRRIRYQHLLSTLPLDSFVELLEEQDADVQAAATLRYAQAGFVGLGFKGTPPAGLAGVHSFHIPQANIPCWRITFPANFAPANVPSKDHWSVLCEISVPPDAEFDVDLAADRILIKLCEEGLVPKESTLISRWTAQMRHGYPVPFNGRDAVLRRINASLRRRGILSRGRFGGWKYEVSNQDHTFMQGVEAIDHLLERRSETTYALPELVN
jgi:protoporphyrinogen oxidase